MPLEAIGINRALRSCISSSGGILILNGRLLMRDIQVSSTHLPGGVSVPQVPISSVVHEPVPHPEPQVEDVEAVVRVLRASISP